MRNGEAEKGLGGEGDEHKSKDEQEQRSEEGGEEGEGGN